MKAILSAAVVVALLSIGPAAAADSQVCAASDLTGHATFQGATGAAEGGVTLVNRSTHTCTLAGRAGISFTESERTLAVRMTIGTSTHGQRKAVTVALRSGERAFVHARWSNWCGRRYRAVGVRLRVRSWGRLWTVGEQLRQPTV